MTHLSFLYFSENKQGAGAITLSHLLMIKIKKLIVKTVKVKYLLVRWGYAEI